MSSPLAPGNEVSIQKLKIAVLLCGALATAACFEEWGRPHASGDMLDGTRPECPQSWFQFPIFDTLRGAKDPTALRPPPTTAPNGVVEVALEGLAVPKAITNIPEYHDCQKFVNESGKGFDSLFAIFASIRLDSIMRGVEWHAVSWTSSNPSVVTVNSSGLATPVVVGEATITAVSNVNTALKAQVLLHVTPPTGLPESHTVGATPGTLTVLSVPQNHTVTVIPQIGSVTRSTYAAAQIYTYGEGYPHLGIGPNFSCLLLYIGGDGNMQARMVKLGNQGAAQDECSTSFDPTTASGMVLDVVRTPGGSEQDYPPVARWDYDATNNRYYIGIMCGDAWCEVGRGATTRFTPSLGHAAVAPASGAEARVLRIKGWYDEQILAVPDGNGGLLPSGVLGTAIPHAELGRRDSADFVGQWVPVSYVALDTVRADQAALDYYEQKFGLRFAPVQWPLDGLNRIEMCYGSSGTCQIGNRSAAARQRTACTAKRWLFFPVKRWWVRISAPGAREPYYTCALRRTHDNAGSIPATNRWRWLAEDETEWVWCIQGCCEIDEDEEDDPEPGSG